jgi:trehalose 6-phosphate phosphatase
VVILRPVLETALFRRLSDEPSKAAIFLDVDGVLAPIVERPEDSRVPEPTREQVARLARRYALVACVSGRTSSDAQRLVGVDGVRYVGTHGLELHPEANEWRRRLHAFAETVAWEPEDKGLTVAYHYRNVDDEEAALAYLEQVAVRAREDGLVALFGRKVLELRPPVHADKGTAVCRLLDETGIKRALYAGDDTTDIDAFRGLASAGLEVAVRVAVSSPEAPPGLEADADVVVEGPAAMLEVLRAL